MDHKSIEHKIERKNRESIKQLEKLDSKTEETKIKPTLKTIRRIIELTFDLIILISVSWIAYVSALSGHEDVGIFLLSLVIVYAAISYFGEDR